MAQSRKALCKDPQCGDVRRGGPRCGGPQWLACCGASPAHPELHLQADGQASGQAIYPDFFFFLPFFGGGLLACLGGGLLACLGGGLLVTTGGGLLAWTGGGLLVWTGGGEVAGAAQVVTTLTSWPIWQWLENWHLK